MYDTIITLIGEGEAGTNQYNDKVYEPKEREVFAELYSVGSNEFYQAAVAGMRPEIKFKLADYMDYAGEKRVKLTLPNQKEQTYSIIRTYRKGNELEVTCKGGVLDVNS